MRESRRGESGKKVQVLKSGNKELRGLGTDKDGRRENRVMPTLPMPRIFVSLFQVMNCILYVSVAVSFLMNRLDKLYLINCC